jgi:uncharacterized membrane protein YgdD (TMEM256/DUF423 family)
MWWTVWIVAAAILAGLGVVFGAFAAHALKSTFSAESMAVFETGVRYQMYHALALMMLGVISTRVENWSIKVSGLCFILGTILFSGSLYALTILGNKQFGYVTPFGGVLFILGWLFLAMSVLQIY